jgi:protein subunit release factor B
MNTRPTPETDREDVIITKGKPTHWVSQEFARRLERERDEARETIATMEIRHAAVMLHTQDIVDEANQFRDQRDKLAEALQRIIEWMDKSGHYDVTPYHQATDAFAAVKGEQYDARKHESHYP